MHQLSHANFHSLSLNPDARIPGCGATDCKEPKQPQQPWQPGTQFHGIEGISLSLFRPGIQGCISKHDLWLGLPYPWRDFVIKMDCVNRALCIRLRMDSQCLLFGGNHQPIDWLFVYLLPLNREELLPKDLFLSNTKANMTGDKPCLNHQSKVRQYDIRWDTALSKLLFVILNLYQYLHKRFPWATKKVFFSSGAGKQVVRHDICHVPRTVGKHSPSRKVRSSIVGKVRKSQAIWENTHQWLNICSCFCDIMW